MPTVLVHSCLPDVLMCAKCSVYFCVHVFVFTQCACVCSVYLFESSVLVCALWMHMCWCTCVCTVYLFESSVLVCAQCTCLSPVYLCVHCVLVWVQCTCVCTVYGYVLVYMCAHVLVFVPTVALCASCEPVCTVNYTNSQTLHFVSFSKLKQLGICLLLKWSI